MKHTAAIKARKPPAPPVRRGPPFTLVELLSAKETAALGRVAVGHPLMDDRVLPLQRRGLLSVQVIDNPHGKPTWVNVSMTEATTTALRQVGGS